MTAEFLEFYVPDRGRHPRSIGGFTVCSEAAPVNFGPLRNLEDITPRHVLLVTGNQAHSRWFNNKVAEQRGENGEVFVVSGARHIDLYDDVDLIPFDAIETFLAGHLS
ncbi:hypothetical protein [Demequina maris]|uniref:hypothetical protein n=1 Tax=Demequina maris TaxID=1638982 RepID=UPI001E33D840|nr:hypothetical protein [Demequina maris]